MTPKQKYRALCKLDLDIPIFSQDWWLDAACGEDNWDVAIVENDGKIIASLPFMVKKRMGQTLLTQPKLTQKMGARLHNSDPQQTQSQNRFIGIENKLYCQLIDELPHYHYFGQTFDDTMQNWLPFYWRGFSQTTRYSYVLNDISNPDEVVKRFAHAKRKDIKKAARVVSTFQDMDPSAFYENHKSTLAALGQNISYSKDQLIDLVEACSKRKCGKTFYASDEEGNVHSAFFIIWDQNHAYFLVSTIDKKFRNSGSTSLLLKEAITYLSSRTKHFDFEGSMIPDVEFSFRQFGGTQRALFHITHSRSRLLRLALSIRAAL